MRPLRVLSVLASILAVCCSILAACSTRPTPRPAACCPLRGDVADVKTCGCPLQATCSDCCGEKDCRCAKPGTEPTLRR